ncbi:YifB family Mg chelatase-like AAA ATPase [Hydrogenimonas thermophila]|uniref:Magnesium chelatase family protein n=1 Tax=Hydrogenimonas thermophila TaxID=223786 RepID=A0A1I5NFK6_9BACT|nr:YifB family Mg chelatase-like AAA ATPase [Hydrogenimonas thermophila]WOE69853.1 YifB family Mg chelatase-like AAA ATPase [Hydrogenimonas thermophila]WOE72368.1 YifB family Mg chelatase-like AAA ATPase [Hydrogenimonas thermophila]SFP20625.1 magnesium chelatase family protein [Hydrogenimonas thermophila]
MKQLLSATLDGINAKKVEVEAAFTKGLPAFGIVGLASSSIQEAKERVKAALLTNGFSFPPLRITVSMSPSDLLKTGSHMDLAIALVIALQNENIDLEDFYVFGELGLDGRLKDTRSIFPILLSLRNQKLITKAIVPTESLEKLSMIPGITYIGVENLFEAIAVCKKEQPPREIEATPIDGETIEVGEVNYFFIKDYPEDFLDVKGQEIAKRASLIAASGMHNMLMEGSPGCGKSMIAKRLQHILPPMSLEEILQANQYALLGNEEPIFEPKRPQRSPHHSASKPSIFGGGSHHAKIGEVALANSGILFFDEFPHFSKTVLEALREPLQDYKVLISRVNSKIAYDTKFMFIAAQNPCPCGNLLSSIHTCRCSDLEIKRYKQRLSDPLLDRIDIYVQMQESSSEDKPSISSSSMHKEVIKAFIQQMKRGQKHLNGKLDEKEIEKYCILDNEAEQVLYKAVNSFGLSHRSVANVKKVSRTIADLEESKEIEKRHILEALSFRRRS